MMSNSPIPGQDHRFARLGLPSIQNAGQYPSAAAPVTLGIWTRLSTRMMPPAGGLKLARLLSTLADVQPPEASRCGVMYRLPLRTSTLFGLLVITSISPVPKLAGPPGYAVPRVSCQFAGSGRPLPLKSSRNVVVQVGAAAATGTEVTTPTEIAMRASARVMASGFDRADIIVLSRGRVGSFPRADDPCHLPVALFVQ